jgi:hypothetical protein
VLAPAGAAELLVRPPLARHPVARVPGAGVKRDLDTISVAVDGYLVDVAFSEEMATKAGMDHIARSTGVVDPVHVRTWNPDPSRPRFWRVEAVYQDPALNRKTVPA